MCTIEYQKFEAALLGYEQEYYGETCPHLSNIFAARDSLRCAYAMLVDALIDTDPNDPAIQTIDIDLPDVRARAKAIGLPLGVDENCHI